MTSEWYYPLHQNRNWKVFSSVLFTPPQLSIIRIWIFHHFLQYHWLLYSWVGITILSCDKDETETELISNTVLEPKGVLDFIVRLLFWWPRVPESKRIKYEFLKFTQGSQLTGTSPWEYCWPVQHCFHNCLFYRSKKPKTKNNTVISLRGCFVYAHWYFKNKMYFLTSYIGYNWPMEDKNQTEVTEFLFLGLIDHLHQQIVLFVMLLFVYLVTLGGT